MAFTASNHIRRADGSEVKIVASVMHGAGLHQSIGTYVLCRADAAQPWRVANDRPHPDWRTMSVAEYVQHGRPETLRLTSFGERCAVTRELRRQLASAEHADACQAQPA